MKEKMRTYNDLVAERNRLEALLIVQRQQISDDVSAIKAELKPVRTAFAFIRKFVSKDKSNPMISMGVSLAGDLLLKNLIFSRAGFLTRQIAPWLIRNFSTHLLNQKGEGILDSISEKIRAFTARLRRRKDAVSP